MTFVYYWWSNMPKQVWTDLQNPIILSLATLRRFSNRPIVVIDGSRHRNEWGKFPKKLKFQVVHRKPSIPGTTLHPIPFCNHVCARLFTIPKIAEEFHLSSPIFHCDCDVFWLQNPEPLACNPIRFCCHPANSGIWYYTSSGGTFLNLWQQTIIRMIKDESFRISINSPLGLSNGFWSDEAALRHLLTTNVKSLASFIPSEENYTPLEPIKIEKAKNLHLIRSLAGSQKGTLACRIIPIAESIRKVLGEDFYSSFRKLPSLKLHDINTPHKIRQMAVPWHY